MAIGTGGVAVAFTESGIAANVPRAPGIYAIRNDRAWLYVGESEDLQEALLAALSDGEACVARHEPTSFTIEVIGHAELRVARQHALILQLHPICNTLPA